MEPDNDFDALTLALTLAVDAPTDADADRAVQLAERIAANMTADEIDRAKAVADLRLADPDDIALGTVARISHNYCGTGDQAAGTWTTNGWRCECGQVVLGRLVVVDVA